MLRRTAFIVGKGAKIEINPTHHNPKSILNFLSRQWYSNTKNPAVFILDNDGSSAVPKDRPNSVQPLLGDAGDLNSTQGGLRFQKKISPKDLNKTIIKFSNPNTKLKNLSKAFEKSNNSIPVSSTFMVKPVSKNCKTKARTLKRISDDGPPKLDVQNNDVPLFTFPIVAYATCEELDLERLHSGLIVQDLYIPTVLSDDMEDVIHVSAKYKISDEPREIFFFREGTVIFWNMPELERVNVLKFLKGYEHERYEKDQVAQELEYMRYYYNDQGPSRLSKGRIVLNADSGNTLLEKYAFANALSSSVKLGIWESTLDKFVDSIAHITEELKRAENLNLSREEVLQKTGELFSLRHELNLNSDLLDTPDFYWERERLESLYQKTCNYLNIGRRTKVLNEKLAQCCELLDLISSHLTDQHHTRLEWMIIALITIEVGFEILHVVERYLF